jgi:hypothetical protein
MSLLVPYWFPTGSRNHPHTGSPKQHPLKGCVWEPMGWGRGDRDRDRELVNERFERGELGRGVTV